ncbi:MAG: response regulator [Lysobacterales bacterium]
MKKVLFVDDEPNILQGLRRLMRPYRDEFSSDFADGGDQALGMLAGGNFDVLVTDMKMPGMTGAQLLEIGRLALASLCRAQY